MPTTTDRRGFLRTSAQGLVVAGLCGVTAGCKAGSSTTASATTKTTLAWWDYFLEPARQAGVRALIADIEAHVPGVRIQRRMLPFEKLSAALFRAASSDSLPDVAIVDNPQVSSLAELGVLTDLTDRVTAWGAADKFYAGPWGSCQANGKVVAVPNNSSCLALFYDVNGLRQAGVAPPTDWAELLAAVRILTTSKRCGLALSAIGNEEGVFQFLPFLWQAGGDLDSFATYGATALDFLTTMVHAGGLSKQALTWTQHDVNVQFIAGRAVMQVNGPWQIPTLDQNSTVRWKVVPLPAGRTAATALGGENWVIFNTSKHIDKVWDVVLRSQQTESLVPYLEALGILPARRDLARAGSWSTQEAPQLFLKQLEKARPRSYGAKYPAMSAAISGAEHGAFAGIESPGAAATAAAATITANLPK